MFKHRQAPAPVTWNSERVAELARLWVLRQSTTAIARKLGVSRSAVLGKIKTLRGDTLRLPKALDCFEL